MNWRPNQGFVWYTINENVSIKFFKVKKTRIEFGYSIHRENTKFIYIHVILDVRYKTETEIEHYIVGDYM